MNYGTTRATLINTGYQPIPIIPSEKRPALRKWAALNYKAPGGYANHGVGIRCGQGDTPIYAVDIDCTDFALTTQIKEHFLLEYGETICRVGKAPKTLLVYRGEQRGLLKKQSAEFNCGRLEILGSGQQFVALGTHPETKQPYSWIDMYGGITALRAADLPVISVDNISAMCAYFNKEAARAGFSPLGKTEPPVVDAEIYDPTDPLTVSQPIGKSITELREMLKQLDPSCGHDEWRNVGMALHHETEGSAEGLALFIDWSILSDKYRDGEPATRWASFGAYTGRPITAAYLLKITEQKTDPKGAESFFRTVNWSISRFRPNPPDMPAIIENMLPRGIVSLFFSAGGAGKSTLLIYLCAKIAASVNYDIEFFGYSIVGGSVVILTAEDPDIIINKRLYGVIRAIATEYFIDENELKEVLTDNLFIVSTFGHAIQLFKTSSDGALRTTKYYTSFTDCLKDIKNLHLVVIDTKTRFSPGEGLGNVTATEEIAHYEAVACETGASVMLLHHTNKMARNGLIGGMQAYRDATGIFDSVRAAWYLRALTQEEIVAQGIQGDGTDYNFLENCKNNYLKICPSLILHRDDYGYTAEPIRAKLTKAERKEQTAQSDLDMLIGIMQTKTARGEYSKGELMSLCKVEKISERRFRTAITTAIEYGLIEEEKAENRGMRNLYLLSDTGKTYQATI